MKSVLFLTAAYPFYPGEQFIEGEIQYWAAQNSAKVIIVPMTAAGAPRAIPPSIDVDLSLAITSTPSRKLLSLFSALVSNLFWKEACFILTTKGFKLGCYARALRAVGHILRCEKAFESIHAIHGRIDTAYCYWNDVQCFSAILMKRRGLLGKVISRLHGGDLYEERHPYHYMPLKRQFIDEMDMILAIGDQGRSYFINKYRALPSQVKVSRLGVPIPMVQSRSSETGVLHIVSVSFCVSIKRIDKIVDSIAAAAAILTNIKQIKWTHIGDGPLLTDIEQRANTKLSHLGIQWVFLGTLPNIDVKKFFEITSVDIFINTSESEGIPVSIMEAMSYGVPVIAPNVGGIAELVSNDYGCLLSNMPTVTDIASAIVNLSTKCKQIEVRALAKQKIETDYNAEKNYQTIVQLALQ